MGNSKIARENLAKEIKNGAVIIHSGDIVYRNNDTWYPFRQNSNFYYYIYSFREGIGDPTI